LFKRLGEDRKEPSTFVAGRRRRVSRNAPAQSALRYNRKVVEQGRDGGRVFSAVNHIDPAKPRRLDYIASARRPGRTRSSRLGRSFREGEGFPVREDRARRQGPLPSAMTPCRALMPAARRYAGPTAGILCAARPCCAQGYRESSSTALFRLVRGREPTPAARRRICRAQKASARLNRAIWETTRDIDARSLLREESRGLRLPTTSSTQAAGSMWSTLREFIRTLAQFNVYV